MAYSAPVVAASSLTYAQLQTYGASGYIKAALATQSAVPAKATEILNELLDGNKSDLPFERLRNIIDSKLNGAVANATIDTELLDFGWVFGQLSTAITEMATLVDAN